MSPCSASTRLWNRFPQYFSWHTQGGWILSRVWPSECIANVRFVVAHEATKNKPILTVFGLLGIVCIVKACSVSLIRWQELSLNKNPFPIIDGWDQLTTMLSQTFLTLTQREIFSERWLSHENRNIDENTRNIEQKWGAWQKRTSLSNIGWKSTYFDYTLWK